MVDELLDLATIEAGETPLNLAPADMGQVVDETLERLRGYADHHQVTLRAESPQDAAARTVPADAARIGQILINVLESAKGKPFSLRTREYILRFGLLAIALLFVVVMYNDTHGWFARIANWVGRLRG
jgi:light-regulated signal transduction histidine kinase (bacteriophytochrome)